MCVCVCVCVRACVCVCTCVFDITDQRHKQISSDLQDAPTLDMIIHKFYVHGISYFYHTSIQCISSFAVYLFLVGFIPVFVST